MLSVQDDLDEKNFNANEKGFKGQCHAYATIK
jgi:hypothetical protein